MMIKRGTDRQTPGRVESLLRGGKLSLAKENTGDVESGHTETLQLQSIGVINNISIFKELNPSSGRRSFILF